MTSLWDKPPTRLLAIVVVALLTLIWGSTWAAIRVSLDGFPPLKGLAIRFAIGGALLLLMAVKGGVRFGHARYERILWLVQTVFVFGISYGLVYWAEQWVPSGLTSVLFATLPFFVVLFAFFMIPGDRLGIAGLMGMVAGFGGVAVIFSEDLSRLGGEQVRFAALVLLLGPVAMAFAEVVVKRWGQEIHTLSLTAVPMAISSVLLGGLAAVVERHRPITAEPAPVAALVYLAVFGSSLAFGLFYWLLKHVSVVRLSLLAYAVPVVAVAVGTIFLDEPLTLRMVVGAGMVVAGAALVMRRSEEPTPPGRRSED